MRAAAKRLLRRVLPAPVVDRLRGLEPARLGRELAFRRLNRGLPDGEIALRPALRLAIDPRSREPFEHFCFRSPEMARELDLFLRESAAAVCLLDVGACHGLFALAFAHRRPDRRALAVEPSPVAFEVLGENLRLNGAAGVQAVRVAAGAGDGTLRMEREWHHLKALPAGREAPDAVEVAVRRLDDLCAELDLAPDLVKVDVEGYELAVLEGAPRVLARRPRLLLEVHPRELAALGRSTAELHRLLAAAGYRCAGLDGAAVGAPAFAARESVFRVLCS